MADAFERNRAREKESFLSILDRDIPALFSRIFRPMQRLVEWFGWREQRKVDKGW